GRAPRTLREPGLGDQAPCTRLDRRIDLRAYAVGGGRPHHRAERRVLLARVVEHVLAREIHETVDELLVDTLVHVHALQATAGLPGVEISAIDDVLDGMCEVGVMANVHRVAATELEPHADETRRRGTL